MPINNDIVKQIYDLLMSSKFEHWYEHSFLPYLNGDEGAVDKKQLLEEIRKLL